MSVTKEVISRYEGVIKIDASAYGLEQERDIKRMRRHLPGQAKVLDIGCGFGLPTAQAAQFFDVSACDVINVHPSFLYDRDFTEMLMRMRGIDFTWINVNELPYPAASFDGILIYAVIEHIADKEPFLRECARVLKPGGKIFAFRAVNKRAFAEWFARRLGIATHGDDVVTEPMLRTAFSNTGFRIDEIGYQGWLPENGLPRWPIYLMNQVLTRIPLINIFSHDYWLIATKT